jgi:sterol 3beta-glucosyltransferase
MAAIMVLTAGSTGDFGPFAALAERLGSRGHTVTADSGFERLAPAGPVEFAPIRADFRSLLPPTPARSRPSLRGEVFPAIQGMLEDSWAVARSRQPEVIVAPEVAGGSSPGRKLDIPYIQALTVPMLTPTREFPLPGIIRHNLGSTLNRASYRLIGLLTRPYAGLISDWRSASLALAPRGSPLAPTGVAMLDAARPWFPIKDPLLL